MSFSAQIGTFRKGSLDATERFRRGVVLKLFSSVIKDTPVLTGRLRANWQTTQGTPAHLQLDEVDKSGSKAIQKVRDNMGDGTTKDTDVFLTNNLPYCHKIEFEGFSAKAPQGMVRKNVARITQLLKEQSKK